MESLGVMTTRRLITTKSYRGDNLAVSVLSEQFASIQAWDEGSIGTRLVHGLNESVDWRHVRLSRYPRLGEWPPPVRRLQVECELPTCSAPENLDVVGSVLSKTTTLLEYGELPPWVENRESKQEWVLYGRDRRCLVVALAGAEPCSWSTEERWEGGGNVVLLPPVILGQLLRDSLSRALLCSVPYWLPDGTVVYSCPSPHGVDLEGVPSLPFTLTSVQSERAHVASVSQALRSGRVPTGNVHEHGFTANTVVVSSLPQADVDANVPVVTRVRCLKENARGMLMILVSERGSQGKAWALQGDVLRMFLEKGVWVGPVQFGHSGWVSRWLLVDLGSLMREEWKWR